MSFEDNPELHDIRTRLSASDSEVRRIALLDIADFEGDDHVTLIVDSLRDPVASVRLQAVQALEAFENELSIPALIAVLDDPDAAPARQCAGAGVRQVSRA